MCKRKFYKFWTGIGNEILLSETIGKWVESSLSKGFPRRDSKWSESIAVGDESFVMEAKYKMGGKAIGRKVFGKDTKFQLRELLKPYNSLFQAEKGTLRRENSYF